MLHKLIFLITNYRFITFIEIFLLHFYFLINLLISKFNNILSSLNNIFLYIIILIAKNVKNLNLILWLLYGYIINVFYYKISFLSFDISLNFVIINYLIKLSFCCLLFILILSIFFITVIPSIDIKLIKYIGLLISAISFCIALIIYFFFSLNFELYINNVEAIEIETLWLSLSLYTLPFKFDSIAICFIILTTLLIFICIFTSFNFIRTDKYHKEYILSLLFLDLQLILTFTINDLLLFYICFESTLIPMYFLLMGWGSRRRKIRAAYLLFFYTLFGSLIMLLGIIYIQSICDTSIITLISFFKFTEIEEKLLWLMFFLSFAIKIPMIPFHIWLPEAHVEAPTTGSVILAGLLLKLGGYGFLRFSIPLFPIASQYFSPFISFICLIAIIYVSLTTLRQTDLKRIIAYSSIGHMNFVVLGIFSLTIDGLSGGMYLMLGHGIVSSASFLLIGILYDRYKTRLLKYYGGLVLVMPLFSIFFFIFTLANMAFPGTCNFIGEFLIFTGVFKNNSYLAILGGFSMLVSAAYSIWLYNRLIFTNIKINFFCFFEDINERELIMLFPLVIITILYGFYTEPLIILFKTDFFYLLFIK